MKAFATIHALMQDREKHRAPFRLALVLLVIFLHDQFVQAAAPENAPVSGTRAFPYVGACLSCAPRLEAIPGRTLLDFDSRPTTAVDFLAASGFNAVRVRANRYDAEQTGKLDNANASHREENFELDWGGLDWEVRTAARARSLHQKVVLTIQFGGEKPVENNWYEFIPDDWLALNYRETLGRIDVETRRLLRPFLNAHVQPDIIIVENEADNGMLYQYIDPDGKMQVRDNSQANVFGDVATGMALIWPKCAGYFKQEILSAKDELKKQGFDPALTRFAVHTTGNPFRCRATFNRIFKNHADAESVYYERDVPKGVVEAVPESLRKIRLADLIDVLGFSCYPQLPKDGSKKASDQCLRQLTGDLKYLQPGIERYGKYDSGPFKGEFRKQVLVVEFGAGTQADIGFDVSRQQKFVGEFFSRLGAYPWTLGALWWEPTYANNNWYHGEGSLFRRSNWDDGLKIWKRFTPIETVRTWGSFAQH